MVECKYGSKLVSENTFRNTYLFKERRYLKYADYEKHNYFSDTFCPFLSKVSKLIEKHRKYFKHYSSSGFLNLTQYYTR